MAKQVVWYERGTNWCECSIYSTTRRKTSGSAKSAQSWVRETIGTWDDCAERFVTAYKDLLERA